MRDCAFRTVLFKEMPERVRIGQIVGVHGIRGQVKVDPLTDFVERLSEGSRLFLRGDWVRVEKFQIHKGRPILGLSGVKDRNTAETLRGEYLEAILDQKPELEEDEFLVEDLIGLKVVDAAGKEIGFVEEVLAYPAQDILQVGEVLIPLVKEFVKSIDMEQNLITVELIPGMLPGEEDEE